MGSGIARTIAGSYTGTGAAKDVKLDKVGFQPRRVTVYRMSTANDMAQWVEGMANASFMKNIEAGTRSLVTSQGITPTDSGFSVGTDAAINNSGDLYRYFCEE